MIALVWLIPAFPLAAFLINGLFGRRWLGHMTGLIATVAVGLSAVVSIGVFLEVLGGKAVDKCTGGRKRGREKDGSGAER